MLSTASVTKFAPTKRELCIESDRRVGIAGRFSQKHLSDVKARGDDPKCQDCGDNDAEQQRGRSCGDPAQWIYDSLLRTRTDREHDQAAQEPTCFQPYQLPLGSCQPPPRPPPRRLLARAHRTRRSRNLAISPRSSKESGSDFSKSSPASSGQQAGSASLSRQPVPRPTYSVTSSAHSSPMRHDRRGTQAPIAPLTRSPRPTRSRKKPNTSGPLVRQMPLGTFGKPSSSCVGGPMRPSRRR